MRSGWRSLAAVAVVLLAGCAVTTASAAVSAKPAPTLGVRTGTFFNGVGFGKVEPKEVFNGGDPTGLVTSITWHDWGKAQAVGTGRGFYVAPDQNVAAGKAESVRIAQRVPQPDLRLRENAASRLLLPRPYRGQRKPLPHQHRPVPLRPYLQRHLGDPGCDPRQLRLLPEVDGYPPPVLHVLLLTVPPAQLSSGIGGAHLGRLIRQNGCPAGSA